MAASNPKTYPMTEEHLRESIYKLQKDKEGLVKTVKRLRVENYKLIEENECLHTEIDNMYYDQQEYCDICYMNREDEEDYD